MDTAEENNVIVVKNTLAFLFPGDAAQPTLADMGRFVKSLKGDRLMMDTAYKISDEKSVFIRFKSEDAMKFTLNNNSTTLPFHYSDGKKVIVRMSVAGGNTRYVRIYDLPPEAADLHLTSVLGKYGTVKRVVRERFPAEIGLDMASGVRGVYIDIQREIPEFLYFHGRKGRVHYQGIKSKCYVCKSDAHQKKDCPIFGTRRGEETHQLSEQTAEAREPEMQAMNVTVEVDEATAPTSTSKQPSKKDKRRDKSTELKRHLPTDSDSSSQQQEKKKSSTKPTEAVVNRTTRSGLIYGLQQTLLGNDKDSDDDPEDFDISSASIEDTKDWLQRHERRAEKTQRRLEKYTRRLEEINKEQ